MTREIQIVGLKECLVAIRHLADSIQRKYTRMAVNAGGGIVKRSAELLAPQRTKLLKQALAVKVTQKKTGIGMQ